MAWHPCRFWQCVENYGGQCFGGGCKLNPMPEPSAEHGDNENTQEDRDGESDN